MRTLTTLLLVAVFFVSCSKKETTSVEDVLSTNDLEAIRKKRTELDNQQQQLTAQIESLNKKISELDTNEKVPLITVLTTKQETFKHYLELQGNVQTKQNVLVYPEMAGILETILVKEGDKVTKGQVLARIDDGGATQQLAQLEAAAQLAKTTYERQKRLWKQKIGSEIQYLQTKTNYETQKNAVEQMKRQLEKSEVVAPFDGVIDDVIKEEGTVVAPGQGAEIFRVVNLGNMYIETDVPESYVPNVKKGVDVRVDFPILGTTLQAKVKQAGNFIDPANRTFKIQIDIPNKDRAIKPNLTAKLRINDYTNDAAILIPQSIISENANGEQYVYRVVGVKNQVGTAKQTIVTTGKTEGDFIEILEGVKTGDILIEEGARSVKNNQKVQITKA